MKKIAKFEKVSFEQYLKDYTNNNNPTTQVTNNDYPTLETSTTIFRRIGQLVTNAEGTVTEVIPVGIRANLD